MAKKIYFGNNNVAKNVSDVLVGVNGTAKRVKKVYIGDSSNIARLAYDNTIVKLIIKPYVAFGKVYSGGSWESDLSNHGVIYRYSSSNVILQTCYSLHQIISYHRLMFQFSDGREEDIAHYCHNANLSVVINTTDKIDSDYSGSGGWNAVIDGSIQICPDTWGTNTTSTTIPPSHTTQNLYNVGTVYGSFLYLSSYSSEGSIQVNNKITFNSCTVGGTTVPIELRTS